MNSAFKAAPNRRMGARVTMWRSKGAKFAASDSGSMAVLAALTLTIMLGVAGGAVDFARALQARTTSQQVMDAAVLAAGRVLQTTRNEADAVAAASSYYNQMKSSEVHGASALFTIEQSSTVVRGLLSGRVNTLLLGVISIPYIPINVAANSALAGGASSGTNFEVSLMLDMTGSMCDNGAGPCTTGTKLNALKDAAADLVNIVVWDNQSTYTSRVAIVPFSTRIRIGPNGGGAPMMKRLTNLDANWSGWQQSCSAWTGTGGGSSETNGDWRCTASAPAYVANQVLAPCVTDRTGPQEFTDANPGPNTWLNAQSGDRMTLSHDSSDTPANSGLGASSADPSYQWNFNPDGQCFDVESTNQVMSLTADKTMLRAKIRDLTAHGSTGGALGTAWAWYMLSPRWNDIWTGPNRPAPYGDLTTIQNGKPLLKKVAILMTDGEYNTHRGWKDQDQLAVSNKAKAICDNMKSAGIEVYTVGFGLDQLTPAKRTIAEDTLRSCGSDIQHFYSALNVEELKGAFRDIAVKLAELRLAR